MTRSLEIAARALDANRPTWLRSALPWNVSDESEVERVDAPAPVQSLREGPLPRTLHRRLLLFWAASAALFVLGWTWRPVFVVVEQAPHAQTARGECPATDEEEPAKSLPGRLLDRLVLRNEDSWRAMRAGLKGLHEHPERPLYQAIFARCIKFQYPPSSLLSLDGLEVLLGSVGSSNPLLNTLSYLFLGVMLASTWRIHANASASRAPLTFVDHATPILFSLTFYPVLKSIELGQIQTWLNGLLAASVLLFMSGRSFAAGLLIGAMATIKPQMALFLPWALLRKDWALAKGIGACGAAVTLLSVLRYGMRPHLEYVELLSSISRHGEAYFANQSFNGLLLRAMHLGINVYFDRSGFAPYHPLVYYGTLVSSLLLVGFAMLVRSKSNQASSGLDLCIAAVCFTIASPIAWEHHYGILPVVFAVCLATMIRAGEQRPALWIALGAAWLLTAVRFAATLALHATSFNFLQSHVYFGALLLIALLHVLRRQQGVAHAHS